jgi:hypothetical protein
MMTIITFWNHVTLNLSARHTQQQSNSQNFVDEPIAARQKVMFQALVRSYNGNGNTLEYHLVDIYIRQFTMKVTQQIAQEESKSVRWPLPCLPLTLDHLER